MIETIDKVLLGVDKGVEKVSSLALIFVVYAMLLGSVATIVLRQFGITFLWLDPLVRHLVFVAIFMGGALATGKGSHICIDIIGTYLKNVEAPMTKRIIQVILSVVSLGTLIWLIKASMVLVDAEIKYGKPEFLGIHSAVLVGIIPVCLTFIVYRFFYRFFALVIGKNIAQEGH